MINKKYPFLFVLLIAVMFIASFTSSSNRARSERETDGPGPARVYVYSGSFEMGGSLRDDITYTNDIQKKVVNVGDFMMDEHEVTNEDWKEFMEANGNDPSLAPDSTLMWANQGYSQPLLESYFNNSAFLNYPVVGITWEQAQLYCEWRTIEYQKINPEAAPFRLPTEAEWEYAAIAYGVNLIDQEFEVVKGSKTYPWDSDGVRYEETGGFWNFKKKNNRRGLILANFKLPEGIVPGNRNANPGGDPPTKSVQGYFPNDFYLFDMAGNVNEWVQNQYNEGHYSEDSGNPLFGITSLVNEKSRVYKGGSWDDGPYWLNPATRRHFQQDQASSRIGFRTVRSTPPKDQRIYRGAKMPDLEKRKPIKRNKQ